MTTEQPQGKTIFVSYVGSPVNIDIVPQNGVPSPDKLLALHRQDGPIYIRPENEASFDFGTTGAFTKEERLRRLDEGLLTIAMLSADFYETFGTLPDIAKRVLAGGKEITVSIEVKS